MCKRYFYLSTGTLKRKMKLTLRNIYIYQGLRRGSECKTITAFISNTTKSFSQRVIERQYINFVVAVSH